MRAQLARRTGAGHFCERAVQTVLDKALLRPVHRRRADTDGAGNYLIGGLGVGSEENLRSLLSACSW